MAKAELGEKQLCPNCGAKFYDLRRRPAVCPKCTTSFDPAEESVRVKRSRSRVAAYDPAEEEEEEETEAAEAAGDEEDEEAAEAPEIDAEANEPATASDDEDDESKSSDELPPGFSEADEDVETDDSEDDNVPLIEDEDEFPEDEIGELPGDDKEDT